MVEENPAIIIDNGSYNIKAGFSGENEPRTIFHSIVGRINNQGVLNNWGKKILVGDEAFKNRVHLSLNYPINHGTICDWDDLTTIWKHTINNELKINSNNHPILVTNPPLNSKGNKEKMLEILFEELEVPSAYIGSQPVLSLYSLGKTNGMAIELGDEVSQFFPILEGNSIPNATIKNLIGGRNITLYLKALLAQNGINLSSLIDFEVAKDIKENYAYLALNYPSINSVYTVPNNSENYLMPDGNTISLGNERFRCAEILFNPSLIGLEISGIHHLTLNSILKCPADFRIELLNNIVLSGGTSMFRNLRQKLYKKILELNPPTDKFKIKNLKRKYGVWIGGSIISSSPSFPSMSISKADYNDSGVSIVHKKCSSFYFC